MILWVTNALQFGCTFANSCNCVDVSGYPRQRLGSRARWPVSTVGKVFTVEFIHPFLRTIFDVDAPQLSGGAYFCS
ncbi:hypothetical protein PAXINDRAFT_168680 [Paxillus involutus ATCC 200175]|nr:hypothetical protein PAXINDRAFT_168680 [Paxillus involutus ATCC 200175]